MQFDSQRDLLLQRVAQGGSMPPQLCNTHKFLARLVHKGNPWDADRTDFEAFAASFGLPVAHSHVDRFRLKLQEAGLWWARNGLQALQDSGGGQSSDHAFAEKLVNAVTDMGIATSVQPMAEIMRIAQQRKRLWEIEELARKKRELETRQEEVRKQNERTAGWVLREARQMLGTLQARTQAGGPGSMVLGEAEEAAAKVDKMISSAVAIQKCPAMHPLLQMAAQVAASCREEEVTRKRLLAAEKRRQERSARDRQEKAKQAAEAAAAAAAADTAEREYEREVAHSSSDENDASSSDGCSSAS